MVGCAYQELWCTELESMTKKRHHALRFSGVAGRIVGGGQMIELPVEECHPQRMSVGLADIFTCMIRNRDLASPGWGSKV